MIYLFYLLVVANFLFKGVKFKKIISLELKRDEKIKLERKLTLKHHLQSSQMQDLTLPSRQLVWFYRWGGRGKRNYETCMLTLWVGIWTSSFLTSCQNFDFIHISKYMASCFLVIYLHILYMINNKGARWGRTYVIWAVKLLDKREKIKNKSLWKVWSIW